MVEVSILLGSGGIATDERRETYRSMVRKHFLDVEAILFVPFASGDHEEYTKRMQVFLGDGCPNLICISDCDDPIEAISKHKEYT